MKPRARGGLWRAMGWGVSVGMWAASGIVAQVSELDSCGAAQLREVSRELGIDFVHASGKSPERHLPESMGAGLAWLDYDGDGWLDLYLVQSGDFPPTGTERSANRLYRSLAGRAFEDVTEASGVGDAGYGQGVVTGDLDGDGDTDMVVTNFGPDVVLINRGDGTFDRRPLANSGAWSASAALGDVDGDGDLDLYVAAYVDYDIVDAPRCFEPGDESRRYCDPSLFRGAADRFYLNDGVGGLVDRSPQLPADAREGRGLGVVMIDLDGDSAEEIYVANDLTPNTLLANDGKGAFENLSIVSGAGVNREGRSEAGMGLAVADFDGDLDPDIAVTNFDVETNTLYENLGFSTFRDVSAASGFGPPSLNLLGFGVLSLDLDRDGDRDFWVGNGHIFDAPSRDNVLYAQPSQVLINTAGRFDADECLTSGEAGWVVRGAAVGDFDNDGDGDIVLQQNNRVLRILESGGASGSFLGLRALATEGGEAVGVRATLTDSGGRQALWQLAGDSYLSDSDGRLLFAVPSGRPDSVDVTWRSGRRRRLLSPPPDVYLTLAEEDSEREVRRPRSAPGALR